MATLLDAVGAVALIFFTAARNIFWPYVLPSLPALALLAAGRLDRREAPERTNAWVAGGLTLKLFASATILKAGLRLVIAQSLAATSVKVALRANAIRPMHLVSQRASSPSSHALNASGNMIRLR